MSAEATATLNGILLTTVAVSLVLAFVRLVRGPSLPDRVVALDVFTVAAVGVAGVYAMVHDETVFLDVALVLALISFVGTAGFAQYIHGRARKEGR